MSAWATTDVTIGSQTFRRGDRVDTVTGGLELEALVKCGSVSLVAVDPKPPAAWSLFLQQHAGREFAAGERVDVGHKPMPAPAIEAAVRIGLVTFVDPNGGDADE